jgi:N6-L-threonylcarbamoyladenine synthase
LLYASHDLGEAETRRRRADLAASYQAAVVAQLTGRLELALEGGEWPAVALGGGVAANGLLRDQVRAVCERHGLRLKLVAGELCTDNAAMIASAARYVEAAAYPDYLEWDVAA